MGQGRAMHGAGESLSRASALPASYYVGDTALRRDHRAVIARSWQLVSHQGLLAEPGDHVVEQVGEVPVLVRVGRDSCENLPEVA